MCRSNLSFFFLLNSSNYVSTSLQLVYRGNYDYSQVNRWTRARRLAKFVNSANYLLIVLTNFIRAEIESSDKLYFPINFHANHWFGRLLIIHVESYIHTDSWSQDFSRSNHVWIKSRILRLLYESFRSSLGLLCSPKSFKRDQVIVFG